jgi:tetratricopeptide (TPR) repeat protein
LATSGPYDQITIKVGEWDDDPFPFTTFVWTSTPTPDAEKPAPWIAGPTVWIVGPELILGAIPKTSDMYNGRYMASLCVRPMETDLLQVAKDAQVTVPVPDLQTLKAYVPLNNARLAYEAGHYQDSITQAQKALSMNPRLQTAYWGIGISYGMLSQWDLAIKNLNAAFKINKSNDVGVYAALQWAKASKKAAKKGQKPMIKGKAWKNPEWDAPWS